jgi:hypothetical protein
MRFLGASSALAMLTVFLCPAVFAATVAPVQGKVSINRGSGYEPMSGPTQAKVGDTVMASMGGSARVVYNDRCSVAVKPGRIVTIAPEPPCKKTASFDPYGTRMNAGVYSGKAFQEPPPRRNWLPLVAVGGLAVVAGLCIGDVICDDGPTSP